MIANPLASPIVTTTYTVQSNIVGCILSAELEIIVSPATAVAGINITSSNNNAAICTGTLVTFNASSQSEGNAPIYQWYINGNPVGNNSASYASSTLQDGDVITAKLTSSLSCVSSNPVFSNGIIWSVTYDDIPGIYETSTNPPDACNGNSEGACNSQVIAAFYSPAVSPSNYASGLCAAPMAGRTDWYLPAICEMGYDNGGGSGCGPMLQNMQTSLVEVANVAGLAGEYWSSSAHSSFIPNGAYFQLFGSGGANDQLGADKANVFGVRCVRAITN